MPYSVSSSFNYQKDQYAPESISRKFTINGSDYTDRVVRWPRFDTRWNEPKAQVATLQLANHDDLFSFMRTNPLTMQNSFAVSVGLNGEYVQLFQGRATDWSFSSGRMSIRVADKLRQLEQRLVGNSDNPVQYTGSNYLLSDVCWWAITSYGGFDATTNSSNVDIDYSAFADWSDVFSASSVYVNAKFDGLTVIEVLRKAARMSQSAIFLRQNKLYFKRFILADSGQVNLDPSNAIEQPTLEYSDDTILNRFHTFAGYTLYSDYYAIDAIAANSASVNSYGLREGLEKDDKLWYVNSASALDYSQRISSVYNKPIGRGIGKTGLGGITLFVGEMFTLTDPAAGLNGEIFRALRSQVDVDKLTVQIEGDAGQIFNGFTLDTSSLNGTDVLL